MTLQFEPNFELLHLEVENFVKYKPREVQSVFGHKKCRTADRIVLLKEMALHGI